MLPKYLANDVGELVKIIIFLMGASKFLIFGSKIRGKRVCLGSTLKHYSSS